MQRIINFFLTMFVFWVSSYFFSEYISINSTRTLILATVGVFVIGVIYGLIMLISALLTPIAIGCLPLLISIVLAPFLNIIELWLLNKYLLGFSIHGVFTYIVLAIVMSVFSISSKSESKEN